MSVPDNDSHAQRGASFYQALPRSRAVEDNSAVALALARFEERVAQSAAPRRLRFSRVWATCALLTTAAFVGGLSLARYSFEPPERPIAVASLGPELMYLPPPDLAEAVLEFSRGPALQANSPSLAVARSELASASGDLPNAAGERVDGAASPLPEGGDLNLGELAGAWSDAARFASGKEWASAFPPTDPAQHGYAGVELSAIPEASTGVVVGVGVAALLAWSHRGRRRTRA